MQHACILLSPIAKGQRTRVMGFRKKRRSYAEVFSRFARSERSSHGCILFSLIAKGQYTRVMGFRKKRQSHADVFPRVARSESSLHGYIPLSPGATSQYTQVMSFLKNATKLCRRVFSFRPEQKFIARLQLVFSRPIIFTQHTRSKDAFPNFS